jgi:hypothetical protein
MTSGSTMSWPATAEAEAAPIWGRGDDVSTDKPIGAAAVMSTATVVSGADDEDPSPAIASGALGAAAPAAATLPRVGAPPMCATCGSCPTAPPRG